MKTIVVKFGGSSLASASQIQKAAAIIASDPARRFAVVSAPGKRDASDTKVTDLLYACYDAAVSGEDFEPMLNKIAERFSQIAAELSVEFDTASEMKIIRERLQSKPEKDYMASRGEYLNARLIAAFLKWDFVDAANAVVFNKDGTFDAAATDILLSSTLKGCEHAVIPGFYGASADGMIHTFSRGGSDVSGALVSRAVNADVYENWTDVSGMLFADPRIVDNPRGISYITYRELRELSYMGASVMHEDAVFPVLTKGIPINIRNTNRPQDDGTMIVPMLPQDYVGPTVTGIAGKTGFTSILLEKSMMNSEIGFGAKLLGILAEHGLSFEHCPSGIDTMSVVVKTQAFLPYKTSILMEIGRLLSPDLIVVDNDLALIAVVGEGMILSKGTAAKIFTAVSDAGVNIRMIDQGSSERSIIIAVSQEDYEKAIRKIYEVVSKL